MNTVIRKKVSISTAVLISFFLSCTGSADDKGYIEYSSLDSLQTSLVFEIGESEDFLPGRLRDLVVTPGGDILVSDWAITSVIQFNAAGDYIGTVAEKGGGPGELSNFFFMYDLGNDTIMVREQSMQKKFYGKSEDGLFRHVKTVSPERSTDRFFTVIGMNPHGNFYATAGEIVRDIQQASKNEVDYRLTPLAMVDPMENILLDSLHLLKTPVAHITQSGNGIRVDAVPYRNYDRFIPLQDQRYLIARPDSGAFFVYNADHKLDRRIPFRVRERPVTSDDLEYALEDVDNPLRGEIKARVHDHKPPYLNVWASADYIWMQIDETREGKEIVVADFEGHPLGKFMLSPHDEIQETVDNRLYVLHKNSEAGETIRMYEVRL